jgi:hypothetical protein
MCALQGIPSPRSHLCLIAAFPGGRYGDKYSAETKYGDKGQYDPGATAAVVSKDENGEKIARLTSIYGKAKADFEAVAARDTVRKLNAARFLRDTAENTMMYFRDPTKTRSSQVTDTHMKELIADLEATCKMAQASVVTLSGGRKRKFDRHDYEVLPRSVRGSEYRGKPPRGGSSRGRSARRWQDVKRDARRRSRSPQYADSSRDYPGAKRTSGYPRSIDSYHPQHEAEAGSHGHPHEQQRRFHEQSSSAPYGYDSRADEQHQRGPDTPPRFRHRHEEGYESGYGSYGGGREQGGPGQSQPYSPTRRASRPESYHDAGGRADASYSYGYGRRGGIGGGAGHGRGRGRDDGDGDGDREGRGGYQPQMGGY